MRSPGGPAASPTTRSGGSEHAERVFRVQQAFTSLGGDIHGPGELARESGLDDSAVFRILQSGIYQGVFERVGRGRYRLGRGTAHLAIHALAHVPDNASHEILEELHDATRGGLVMLYLLAPFGGAKRQCVDMAVGDSDLSEYGLTPREVLCVTRSLRTGASGRTILAYLPEAIQQRVLAEPVPEGAGPGAIHDNETLFASLADIRDQGYAVGLQECMTGWNSCAAPIVWDDSIMGSLLLLKPAAIMPEPPNTVIEATKAAAARLSRIATAPWAVMR
ncbi:IclR family transcriptional regulator domain-containing protein [Streptomyces millisiae]|uniref:IclR family transcriptional regulator C-terminal domain-containing protein n=1 Tax=Streptomyces millisiae TaxID=3075542 RepID=A0ABU2LNX8_9ACTN|nr:IclR family transcriptional regulator C-terminal domain-containing protein [Streptomyces sp. DSM 44918]MDT0319292.1 IclR family transcriptional regulator C-terminal domain-containing protein [Streptomyces sp. DSM 44918]